MSQFFAAGSPTTDFSEAELREALAGALEALGPRQRVLAVPPDYTRLGSQAGRLTSLAYEHYGERLAGVLPAVGTHAPMTPGQIAQMFPGLPAELILTHHWRHDAVTVGEVPGSFVEQATEGLWRQPWPAQLSRHITTGDHDLVLSLGQVVPHEVIGMANHNKNLFVGTGGSAGINESHYISAVWGIDRTLGQVDVPLRRILNEAERLYCGDLPIVYVLTVVSLREDGTSAVRGLFVGDDEECFRQAAELSAQVNITRVAERPRRIVAWLDPEKYHSTWLGNKSIYRTRLAIAAGGELVVLAPGVRCFGEDEEIDRLIRRYGYRPSAEVQQLVEEEAPLRQNLSAAAHLIHGSPEGRFTVTYGAGGLSREEIEGVGYRYADCQELLDRYDPQVLAEGPNRLADGEEIYFISSPAGGLWKAE